MNTSTANNTYMSARCHENFENEITVLEGDYGRFFNQSELEAEKLIEMDMVILFDVFGWLRNPK